MFLNQYPVSSEYIAPSGIYIYQTVAAHSYPEQLNRILQPRQADLPEIFYGIHLQKRHQHWNKTAR